MSKILMGVGTGSRTREVILTTVVAAIVISSIIYFQFMLGTSNVYNTARVQAIVPPNSIQVSCPAAMTGEPVTAVSPSSATNISVYDLSATVLPQQYKFPDYVIPRGGKGIIQYEVNKELINEPNAIYTNITNVTNGFFLIHTSYKTVQENVTQVNVTLTRYANGTFISSWPGFKAETYTLKPGQNAVRVFSEGTTLIFPNGTRTTLGNDTTFVEPNALPIGTTTLIAYSWCYSGGGCGQELGARPPEFLNMSYYNYSHPGISVTINPALEAISSEKVAYVSYTISVDQNATLGTYLFETNMKGELCGASPEGYLTIGTSPYSGNAPSLGVI